MEIALSTNHNENNLIGACIRNERWAQQVIYEEYYGSMMGVCMRYASTEDDALDILQEGFIKVFRNISKYKPGTSLHSWIRRVMVNTAIDYYRKSIRRRTEDIDTAYQVTSKDVDAISRCTEKEILAAVQQLTPTYRTVFNMYVVEGYSHKEIGEYLNITESTSRSNLVKARNRLKHLLKNYK